MDAAPVFEPAEHAVDKVATLVAVGGEGNGPVSVGPTGDTGFDRSVGHEVPEPIAVILFAGDEMLGIR